MERIKQIPAGEYIGYYWMSDAVDPVVIHQADHSVADHLNLLLANPEANPFVIEGQLYDADSHVSISIKYVDGRYLVHRYDVPESIKDVEAKKFDNIAMKHYAANRMPGVRLCFFQYWREHRDPLCCDMPVLTPAEKVFVGFVPINTNEK